MGCDGIWEVLNAHELCTIVQSRLVTNAKADLVPIVETLLDKGLAPTAARKNILTLRGTRMRQHVCDSSGVQSVNVYSKNSAFLKLKKNIT